MQYNILGKIKCSLCAHNINIDVTHPVFFSVFRFLFLFCRFGWASFLLEWTSLWD